MPLRAAPHKEMISYNAADDRTQATSEAHPSATVSFLRHPRCAQEHPMFPVVHGAAEFADIAAGTVHPATRPSSERHDSRTSSAARRTYGVHVARPGCFNHLQWCTRHGPCRHGEPLGFKPACCVQANLSSQLEEFVTTSVAKLNTAITAAASGRHVASCPSFSPHEQHG